MRFFFDRKKQQQQKLEKFRASFRLLTADGEYPPDRQQRLFQACQKAGLAWDDARQFVRDDAVALLTTRVERLVAAAAITATEISDLRKLQKRLAVPDEAAGSVLTRLFDVIERRLANKIIDYAAYIGESEIASGLKTEIARYDLPQERSQCLVAQIERQHQLATLLLGNLPVVPTQLGLFRDEACHFDTVVTVMRNDQSAVAPGRLVITSQRLLVLSATGGFTVTWPDCHGVETLDRFLVLNTRQHPALLIQCSDPIYVATLIAAARRRYVPQAAPTPIRPGKRLESGSR
jgi:hypothetical protein